MVDVEPLPPRHLQPPAVEAELVQDRGVNVGHVVAVRHGVEADLVRRITDARSRGGLQ